MSDRLKKLSSQINLSASDDSIGQLIQSKDKDKVLLAIMTIREKVENDFIPSPFWFEIVKDFLSHSDDDCKWQSYIIIGCFLETRPEECWQIIIQYGDSANDDTRSAVATILLEHYFEKNPHLFDIKFREYRQLIKAGRKNLLLTLATCWSDWGSEINRAKVKRYLESQK